MKKLFASFLFVIMITSVFGQNADQKWSVGIMGGKTEYYGDLGNGFFKFNPFYGLGGLSVSYYLFPSIDAGIQGSYGDYGFRNDNGEKFLTRKTDVSLYLHYKFNNGYILKEDCRIAPYLTAGWAKNRRVEFKVVF